MSDIRGYSGFVVLDEAAFHEAPLLPPRKCRACGCTQNAACMTEEGPCYWIEEDLCSACLDAEDGA